MARIPSVIAGSIILALILPYASAVPAATTSAAATSTAATTSTAAASALTVAGKPKPFSGSLLTGSVAGSQTLTAGQAVPSGFYNPNGLAFNPNDYTKLPFTWPGKPTASGQKPPPKPSTRPFPSGGPGAGKYQAPGWAPSGAKSFPSGLPQSVTNGNSKWGLINNPTLAVNNGTGQVCGTAPDTGVTVSYDLTVSYQNIAPDGVVKNGLVINGGFPGPLIEANWGDTIQVTVHNNLTDEGTSLHWHGLLQVGTPWYDGVPSVSQCPIAPGATMVYTFKAEQYGSSWYHSHYSAQYSGGALGPIVIHGPKLGDYDVDIGPVMVTDWYHSDYFTLVNETMQGGAPVSNNNLINGKMNYPCENTTAACVPNAGISKFQFQSGKKYLLRVINTSGEGIEKFTIDGHSFTVVANDFVPITPYNTSVITLGVGQRSDIIVLANGTAGSAYWMRSDLGTIGAGCSNTDGVSPQAVAAVYYENADTSMVPNTTSSLTTAELEDCGNDALSLTTARCAITPDPAPPAVQNIDIVFQSNGTNFIWFMNGESFRGDYNSPVLEDVKQGNLSFPAEWNVYNFGSNSSVRLIVQNTFQFSSHPMHLHGHNFHVLAEGFGTWDGVVTNPNNTQRRDVQLVRAAQDATTPAYIVLQWTQDNPSVWPFHCHIAWHVSGGLYINILERPDDVMKLDFPSVVADTCASWDTWTSANIPDQIDSGL
ncbi:hypothetical protein BT63DRAFT_365564 [Microthyrium microscopicum]|uniref:Multicopper oxidase n=1 Tax=Microthyrium microscopicum TaxID=703497 RepID=A0A6A6UV00_9PEZI|nr:hypothetical protein BT63DRAFT_365564 [Microthyrium microscopicum]